MANKVNAANRIQSATLRKLTTEEVGELGLLDGSIWTYRGELKSRKAGWQVVDVIGGRAYVNKVNGFEFRFEKLADDNWACRLWDAENSEYIDFPPLAACDFIR